MGDFGRRRLMRTEMPFGAQVRRPIEQVWRAITSGSGLHLLMGQSLSMWLGTQEDVGEPMMRGRRYLLAHGLLQEAKPAGETPLPGPGNVVFYFLSSGGTFTYSAAESALGGDKDRMSALFHAGHRVITEIRKIEQSGKS